MNEQIGQMVRAMTSMMVVGMSFGMVRPVMLQKGGKIATQEGTHFISPKELYDDPNKFGGVISAGIPEVGTSVDLGNARVVDKFMRSLYSDWPKRLSRSLSKHAEKAEGRWYTFAAKKGGYAYPVDVSEFIID